MPNGPLSDTRFSGFIAAHVAWVGSVSTILFTMLRKLGLLRITDAQLAAASAARGFHETLDDSTHAGVAFVPALPAVTQVTVMAGGEDAQSQGQAFVKS